MGDKVEDQELDAAAEAVEDNPVEDVVEETVVEENDTQEEEEAGSEEEAEEVEEEEEPADNAIRSKMGRRLSGLEQQLANMSEKLEQANKRNEDPEEEVDGDMPMTRNELKAFTFRTMRMLKKMPRDSMILITLKR